MKVRCNCTEYCKKLGIKCSVMKPHKKNIICTEMYCSRGDILAKCVEIKPDVKTMTNQSKLEMSSEVLGGIICKNCSKTCEVPCGMKQGIISEIVANQQAVSQLLQKKDKEVAILKQKLSNADIALVGMNNIIKQERERVAKEIFDRIQNDNPSIWNKYKFYWIKLKSQYLSQQQKGE